jgi:hypothetical protein
MEETPVYIIGTNQFVGCVQFAGDPRPTKKRRLNPLGENVYILPDGTIKREVDAIISAQRIWRERAYEPGKGVMYLKGVEHWRGHCDAELSPPA